MNILRIKNFAKIKKAKFTFKDLTVFVGPQGTGKTLVLELIKLVNDYLKIVQDLKIYGYDWKEEREFLSLYFGEGMDSLIWKEDTQIQKDNREFNFNRRGKPTSEKVFYIPAQRALVLEDGWPRPFGSSYYYGAPYVVRRFSEDIRILVERMKREKVFPADRKLRRELRNILNKSIFWNTEVSRSLKEMKRKITLEVEETSIPFLSWSAGQREFVPLLLGLYFLLPAGRTKRRNNLRFIIIEEPEMGLHPKAIEAVMLLILELLNRGYKVLVSTHSQIFLDMLWAIQNIKRIWGRSEFKKGLLKKLFDVQSTSLDDVFASALKKEHKVYYFKPEEDKVTVKDISSLDVFAEEDMSEWGGLTTFSSRASEVVSIAVQGEGEKDELF